MQETIFKGRKFGYARVSTQDQNLELQIQALHEAGCIRVFTDKISGAKDERPGLRNCLTSIFKGDCLLVWRLDRLGRSMKHLVDVITNLKKRGIGFRSIKDGAIDTTTASGELIFNIFAALAQFERELIRERTKAGLAVARELGRIGGRPRLSMKNPKIKMALEIFNDKKLSVIDACNALGISKSTYYRYISLQPSNRRAFL